MKIELKQKIRKITRITIWCLMIVGLFVTLGFAGKEEGKMRCKSMKVSIMQSNEFFFVDEQDIRQMILDKGDSIINQPMSTIDINNLEKLMYTNTWVSKAEVYASIGGELKIDLEQRKPILRVINRNDESFYLDTEGKLMLWSQKFTPRVLVASGNIFESYNQWYKISVNEIVADDSLKKLSCLDDLYTMAKYISENTFWNAQVEQVVVNVNNELEIVPRVGNHKIIFGNVADMENKFIKLKTFYKMGLNNTGWNNYDTLNLKYKNQVVASKKNNKLEGELNGVGESTKKKSKKKVVEAEKDKEELKKSNSKEIKKEVKMKEKTESEEKEKPVKHNKKSKRKKSNKEKNN